MTLEDRREIPLAVAAAVPGILLGLSGSYLRFLARRKSGVRAFKRALREAGVPSERVAPLAQAYHDAGSLRKILARGR